MCNSTMHVSSMEKNIAEGSQSLLPLFLGFRGVFLVLEGVLQSWTWSMGTGAETGPPKRGEDSLMALLRSDIFGLPLLSQMIQVVDFCSRKQNEPLSKTTVCAMTFPCHQKNWLQPGNIGPNASPSCGKQWQHWGWTEPVPSLTTQQLLPGGEVPHIEAIISRWSIPVA